MSNRLKRKFTVWTVTSERAEALRGPLLWLGEAHPQKEYRRIAANILSRIRDIRGEMTVKQVVLTMKEKEVLQALMEAFPEALVIPRQLGMELKSSERPIPSKEDLAAGKFEKRLGGLLPMEKQKKSTPTLRGDLTLEEQKERDLSLEQGTYQPLPESYWNAKLRGSQENE